ncbi:hypothetical protein GCM10027399_07430 [Curvibacter fontanus]
MSLFIDVDAICKLAHWQLLDKLPALLGTPIVECVTLSSVRYRAQRCLSKPDGRLFQTADAAQAVLAAVTSMKAPLAATAFDLSVFENASDIDPGEAVLLAAVIATPGARLLTGDKRALRAISKLASIRPVLAGRVVMLEHVLLLALDTYGLDWVRKSVCPQAAVDKAIFICMGSRCDAPEISVREGFESYLNEIRCACDPTILIK